MSPLGDGGAIAESSGLRAHAIYTAISMKIKFKLAMQVYDISVLHTMEQEGRFEVFPGSHCQGRRSLGWLHRG